MNTVVQLRPSTSEKPTVSPRRGKKNLDYRSQEYLDEAQIERSFPDSTLQRRLII
jgi:hypothetical protein